jgi:hypothetical protein
MAHISARVLGRRVSNRSLALFLFVAPQHFFSRANSNGAYQRSSFLSPSFIQAARSLCLFFFSRELEWRSSALEFLVTEFEQILLFWETGEEGKKINLFEKNNLFEQTFLFPPPPQFNTS